MAQVVYVTRVSLQDDTLYVGERKTYSATVIPTNATNQSLQWSYTRSVIKLLSTNGLTYTIEAIAPGVGSISALTKFTSDGTVKGDSASITVIQPVKGIQVSVNSITVPVKGTAKIAYTILPSNASNKAVTIQSSNTDVVSVSGDYVVGVSNGTANITITTLDGGYTAAVRVTVQGEYVWYDYPAPIDILNVDDLWHIISNMEILRSRILLLGGEIGDFEAVDAQTNTPYRSMRGLLQGIENNLDVLNATPYFSAYYGAPVTVGMYASDKQDIWRWLRIINDMYAILSGKVGMWQTLLCSDGYPTIDGKRIIVRGDFVG